MTQFHQEEQKRFDEFFPISIEYPPISEMEVFTQIEIDRRHKVALARQELLHRFMSLTNLRAMKHILEELLAEIPEDEECPDIEFSGLACGTCKKCVMNKTFSFHRSLITKKLSDIALEE